MEYYTLENGTRAFRTGLSTGLLMTQKTDGRISLYRYDDESQSSQYITSMSQEELQSLASYFAG